MCALQSEASKSELGKLPGTAARANFFARDAAESKLRRPRVGILEHFASRVVVGKLQLPNSTILQEIAFFLSKLQLKLP